MGVEPSRGDHRVTNSGNPGSGTLDEATLALQGRVLPAAFPGLGHKTQKNQGTWGTSLAITRVCSIKPFSCWPR